MWVETRSRLRTVGRTVIWVVFAALIQALPWLWEAPPPIGWFGIAVGMSFVARHTGWSGWLLTWTWASLSIALAFHWAPGALAYTLSSGYAKGLLVAIPLVLWDGLRLGTGYWLATRCSRLSSTVWLSAAAVSVVIETWVPSVFPWRLGYTQLQGPLFVQGADVFGPGWGTLVAFAGAGMLTDLARVLWQRLQRPDSSGGLAWLAMFRSSAVWFMVLNIAYGYWAVWHWQGRMRESPPANIAMIQVDPSFKQSVDQLRSLTSQVAGDADLVCWPESSGGTYDTALRDFLDEERIFQCSRDPERGLRPWPHPACGLLLGAKTFSTEGNSFGQLFVSAMLIDEMEQVVGRYNKRHLMPFGEYVPGKDSVPGLDDLFDLAEEITPGTRPVALPMANGIKIGPMMCYEDMLPEVARTTVLAEANVLISLINGSAFESQFALKQHRMLAQMRAIETRRYFLRCAATGETCVISPLGHIESRLPLNETGALLAPVRLLEAQTWGLSIPLLLPGLCLLRMACQIGGYRPGADVLAVLAPAGISPTGAVGGMSSVEDCPACAGAPDSAGESAGQVG